MPQGCILGCLTIESAINDQIDVTEDPAGTPSTWTTSITAGDYFPDSATGAEDLCAVIKSALDTRSAAAGKTWTYTVSISTTTGKITIAASGGDFQLKTNTTTYSDSVFPQMGFPTTDPTSASSSLTSTTPPKGTVFWVTCDGGEELEKDSEWREHNVGSAQTTTSGKRTKLNFGYFRDRTIGYNYIVGSSFSSTYGDKDRARTCFNEHWRHEYKVRVFTDNRTLTGTDYFEATITDENLEPARVSEELDWWGFDLNFQEWVD